MTLTSIYPLHRSKSVPHFSILVCTLHIKTLAKSLCGLLAMNTCLSISLKRRNYRKFKSVTFCQQYTFWNLSTESTVFVNMNTPYTKNKHMLIWKLPNFKIRQANVGFPAAWKRGRGAFRKRAHGARWVIRKGHILCARAMHKRQKGYFQCNVEKH